MIPAETLHSLSEQDLNYKGETAEQATKKNHPVVDFKVILDCKLSSESCPPITDPGTTAPERSDEIERREKSTILNKLLMQIIFSRS